MKSYKFTCTCGAIIIVQGDSKEEAAGKVTAMLGKDLAPHIAEKHPGEGVPPIENAAAFIISHIEEIPT